MTQELKRAVFLDRDGTINKEVNFLHKVEELEILPDVPNALIKLREKGFVLVVVTNQSGVARGLYDLKDVDILHKAMDEMLAEKGAEVDGYYVCPHHPKEGKIPCYSKVCDCRKPLPGLLTKAAKDFNIDLKKSFMIGDRQRDVAAGLNAGCKSIMVTTGQDDGPETSSEHTPHFKAPNLYDAALWIIDEMTKE